jgi:hypothetical protein
VSKDVAVSKLKEKYLLNDKQVEYIMSYSIKKLIEENPKSCTNGEITARYAKLLEENIMAQKYNWLWSHKRWKRGFTEEDRAECNKILLSLLDGKEN